MDDKVNMTKGIQQLMLPFYDLCKEDDETLEKFVETFFTSGGEINIKFPEYLKQKLGIETPEPKPEESHFLIQGPEDGV